MLPVRPLAGVTVLEIGHSVAAPYAGMLLGELGAEVIKLENPKTGGDYARGWGPPFAGDDAVAFKAFNRSKKSIAVDFADERGADQVRRLVAERCDVVLHNFKFGALERHGLGAAALLELKPTLIYCSLGAFGPVGPMREYPGYDPLIQAFAGLMSMQGDSQAEPSRIGVSIIDMAAGMWAVIGILAALRAAAATGHGGEVGTSLLETGLGWMTAPIAAYLSAGDLPGDNGSGAASIVPYQAFATADGQLMVLAGNDGLFRRLLEVMDLPAVSADARFKTNRLRVLNRHALIPLLSAQFRTRSAGEWMERLHLAGVPNGPIQTIDQVVGHPQTTALDIIQAAPEGDLRLIGLPLRFGGERPSFTTPPPSLGEHNLFFGLDAVMPGGGIEDAR
jgi:crotonobetainyl-CoA:carnitine CoA-transferase CaiB-like acyl-CoA transferase